LFYSVLPAAVHSNCCAVIIPLICIPRIVATAILLACCPFSTLSIHDVQTVSPLHRCCSSTSPSSFRGIELEALLDKSQKELLQLLTCRIRRRFARGIPRIYNTLLKKLRKAKKATAAFDKPATVKTHLRNMPIIPEMIGSVVGVYNGQFFVNVEIKVCWFRCIALSVHFFMCSGVGHLLFVGALCLFDDAPCPSRSVIRLKWSATTLPSSP
jgi:small subunit ribosomal protein S15e